jgi:V/A-type H+-transporting ATPase subunit K
MSKSKIKSAFRKKLLGFGAVLAVFVGLFIVMSALKIGAQTVDKAKGIETAAAATGGGQGEIKAEAKAEGPKEPDANVRKWAIWAAAIAVGIGSMAGGGAVGYVGAAAMGAIGEKPELAGRALIFVGLAEGIAIYGLIIGIMILGKV